MFNYINPTKDVVVLFTQRLVLQYLFLNIFLNLSYRVMKIGPDHFAVYCNVLLCTGYHELISLMSRETGEMFLVLLPG